MYAITVDTFNGEVEWKSNWIIVKVKQKREDVETEIEFLTTGVTREQVYINWNVAVESIRNLVNVKPIENLQHAIRPIKVVKEKEKEKK
jgi:hypothetical protein